MMKRLYTLFASVLVAATIGVNAQNVKVSGTVTDSNGPVAGAVVQVKGTSIGTATGNDGKFSINADANAILEVSCLGYLTFEEAINGRSVINLTLQEDKESLDEVIVVGYGTATKRSLISSVSSIKAEDISELPVPNITQQLAGRTPGIIAKQSGGGINTKSTISIRGGGTPLIVIDGIIRTYDDFTSINPEDIESLNILKDASATAIYGSRSAYGIIQITTKKGMATEKPLVDYSFQRSFSTPTVYPEAMDSWDRAYYTNLGRANDGMEPAFNDAAIQAMKDGSDPENYSNTKWADLLLRKFAPMHKHMVTMQGGSKTTSYYTSIGYLDQKALYKADINSMQRTNINLKISNLIEKIGLRTTASIDGYLQNMRDNNHSYLNDWARVYQNNPLYPAYNKLGLPYEQAWPLRDMDPNAGYKKYRDRTFNGQLSFDWSLPWIKGLSLKAIGNYRTYANSIKQWSAGGAGYQWESDIPLYNEQLYLRHSTDTGYRTTVQFLGEYKNTFGKHSVNVLGGYESSYAFWDSYWERRGPYDFSIDQMSVGPESTQTNNGSEYEQGRAAWLVQGKYSFDNRYYVEGSMRYDGSDLFPKDRRWGTFFSGSIGWHLANEAFMKSLKEKHVFDVLKLRASYGETGIDNWDSPYSIERFAYLPSYNFSTTSRVINGEYVSGFTEGALPSTEITWFTTYQSDAGFDFESLNNRLYGSFDWFYYRTKGFLYTPDPLVVGYTAPLGTSLPKTKTDGEHRREGFDFNLGWRDNISDFTYDISFNFTKFDQLWNVKPDESETSLMNPYARVTQQTGYYGTLLHSLGYYTSSEDVYNSVKRTGSTELGAGDIKYEDFNGDGKIDSYDNQRLGYNSFPRANYGLLANLGYKGFNLNMLIQGATRYDLYIKGFNEQLGTYGLPIAYEYETDFWTPDHTNAPYPRITSSPSINGNNNYQNSDWWLINGAYLRLKSLSLSYDFKYMLLKRLGWIRACRLSLSGTNLITISKANKYLIDPEDSSTNHYGYPNERTYSIALNIGF